MIEANFLNQLTDAVNKARTEYELEFQNAWLSGDITMSPDEYIAMMIGGMAAKWVEDNKPKPIRIESSNRKKGGQQTVRLPSQDAVDSPKFEHHATILLRGLGLKVTLEHKQRLYNFLGALRTK